MITVSDYLMGREKRYAADLTTEVCVNAAETVNRVNALLKEFGEERHVTSGWRPPEVNASTPNAAKRSNHMLGLACDIEDPEGDLDEWCVDHPEVLERLGLFQEHPATTKGWAHLQTVPPRSGKRTFYP